EKKPSVKNCTLFTFFFLLQAFVSWYLAVITVLLLLIVAACTANRAMLERRHLFAAIITTVLCVTPLAELAVPYAAATRSSTLAQRYDSVMSETRGVNLNTFFVHYGFPPDATLSGSRIQGNRHWIWGENTLYIGYIPLLLALAGLRKKRDYESLRLRRIGISLVIVGAILAVGFVSASGLKLPLYYAVRAAPILASFRAAQRFSLL